MKKHIAYVTLLIGFLLLTGCCRTGTPQFFPENELLPIGKVNQFYEASITIKGPPYMASYIEHISTNYRLINKSSDSNLQIHIEQKKWGNIITISGIPSKAEEHQITVHAIQPSTMTCLGESFSNRYILKVTE